MNNLLFIGEPLQQLIQKTAASPTLTQRFAGDVTPNMSYYFCNAMNHAGNSNYTVYLLTSIGCSQDQLSNELLSYWQKEPRIDTSQVKRIRGAKIGSITNLIYNQSADASSEKFKIDRENTPTRKCLENFDNKQIEQTLSGINIVVTSAIFTGAVYNRQALVKLFETAQQRAITTVYSTNFVAAVWSLKNATGYHSKKPLDDARKWNHKMLIHTDVAFMSFENERALWNDSDIHATYTRVRKNFPNIRQLVITNGPDKFLIYDQDICQTELISPKPVPFERVIDTSGAGDSFAGVYFANRLLGRSINEASTAASEIASQVIQFEGMIPSDSFQLIYPARP